jgi:hypothetical protein
LPRRPTPTEAEVERGEIDREAFMVAVPVEVTGGILAMVMVLGLRAATHRALRELSARDRRHGVSGADAGVTDG